MSTNFDSVHQVPAKEKHTRVNDLSEVYKFDKEFMLACFNPYEKKDFETNQKHLRIVFMLFVTSDYYPIFSRSFRFNK